MPVQSELTPELIHLLLDLRTAGHRLVPLEVDADGKGPDKGRLPRANHLGGFLVDPGLDRPIDRIEEVLAMVAEVKSQQIVAQKPFQKFFLPGKNTVGLGIGPGNVPELSDDQVGIAVLRDTWAASRSDSPG